MSFLIQGLTWLLIVIVVGTALEHILKEKGSNANGTEENN